MGFAAEGTRRSRRCNAPGRGALPPDAAPARATFTAACWHRYGALRLPAAANRFAPPRSWAAILSRFSIVSASEGSGIRLPPPLGAPLCTRACCERRIRRRTRTHGSRRYRRELRPPVAGASQPRDQAPHRALHRPRPPERPSRCPPRQCHARGCQIARYPAGRRRIGSGARAPARRQVVEQPFHQLCAASSRPSVASGISDSSAAGYRSQDTGIECHPQIGAFSATTVSV